MATAGITPAALDLTMIRGDDFELPFQILTCDSLNSSNPPTTFITETTVIDGVTWTPLDLTGSVVTSQIRKSTAMSEALAMSFTIVVIDPLLGYFEMKLTKEETANLAMSDTVKYTYDTQVTTIAGINTTYMNGQITIILDVTR